MRTDRDQRTYDVLRLIDEYGPIGSVRLVDRLRRRGYSVTARMVRVILKDLDGEGLTRKVDGKGRELTDRGRVELARGDVGGRRGGVKGRIAVVTSEVTYDPDEGGGAVATSSARVARDDLGAALSALERLAATPLAPVPLVVEPASGDDLLELVFPNALTLDGVLLSNGIAADLQTAGIVEYRADPERVPDGEGDVPAEDRGGAIVRYVDAVSGDCSTIEAINLLIETGRPSIESALSAGEGLLLVDNRRIPITRYEAARALVEHTRATIGGAFDIRRPRERGPFPGDLPDWNFASIAYCGIGENALGLLSGLDLAVDVDTIGGVRPWDDFGDPDSVRTEWLGG